MSYTVADTIVVKRSETAETPAELRKRIIRDAKEAQIKFDRGEYKTDVWALEEELRAYAREQFKRISL